VQEIPDEARKLYKKGVMQLEDKKDEGLDSLKRAIEIFPTYYDALDRLGTEYTVRKQYQAAAPYLVKAVEVNNRSYSSFYALGITSYSLKNYQAAAEALRAATELNPQSINAQLFYGLVLRVDGSFEKAEKALLQAKSLSEKSAPVSEIHWQLALLYQKTERYKEAADELEQYLKIERKAPNVEQIKKLIVELRAKAK
jgi:tetratricopeptide (TPR) repeat protein